MPYKSNAELPENVKGIPAEAQTIFRKAFNSALTQYGNEDQARKVAWSAVKRKYHKNKDGKWVLNKSTQSFIELVCERVQSFNQNEIIAMIPSDTLAEIKRNNEHPYFAAYSICHEGLSTPKIIGEGFKPILWTKRAVQSLRNIVLKGIKFFLGHNDDNSTEGRQNVGEVIANVEKEIDGKLHHIVIGYFPDKQIVANKDICSQEGNWNLFKMAKRWVADNVQKITGIALSDSYNDTPAFPDAKRLGMVQAFNQPGDGLQASGEGDKEKMEINSFNDLKPYIKKFNVHPHQIFSLDEIKSDKEFGSVFSENEDLKKQIKDKDEKIDGLEKTKNDLDKQVLLSTAKTRLNNLMTKGDIVYTDLQKNRIDKYFEKYKDKVEDLTDEGLGKFIKTALEDIKFHSEILGVDSDSGTPDFSNEGATNTDDPTKADNNELLEEDFEGE